MCLQSLYRLMKTDKNQFSREGKSLLLHSCRLKFLNVRQTGAEVRARAHHQKLTPPGQVGAGCPVTWTATWASRLSGGGTYYRTSRSQHLWPNCSRGIPWPHAYNATDTNVLPTGTEEPRSEHSILTDAPAHLCQSRGRKRTGIQMLGDSEG